jgi:PAS domain S-box-containing protein
MQSVNAATTRLLGYAPEELLGRNVSMLMPQPDRRQHDRYMENYLRTGVRKVIGIGREVLGQRKDGSVVPMELTVSETRLPQGRLFTGMLRDISKRKTAEEAQALLVEAGTVLAQSLDVPTTVRNLATLAVARLADYCMVDLLDESGRLQRLEVRARDPERQALIREATHHPPVVGSQSPGARVLATGKTLASEVTPAWNESVSWSAEHRVVVEGLMARSSAVIPLIARGRTLGVMSLLSLEPGRMTSPSVLILAEALADRAALAIDNARLYREAQEAVRVREDVVAIVSHDLRTPLNAISLAVSALLKREDLDARTTKTASRIYSAADRANRMIRDLLDFTQARAGGGIPIRPAPVDLHRLMRQVVEEVRLSRPERHILLVSRGDGRGAWDEDRLAQVIANLVGNALQHSPPESPVKVVTREEDGGVAIEVHNEGAPISAELLPLLFEPYRRGPDASVETGSMGLGLFITRQIVLGHGGRIDVHSAEGEGTTFTVRLPRQAPAEKKEPRLP